MDQTLLRRASIFSELEDSEATALLAVARPLSCRTNDCLFLLGEPADRLYVLLSGTVELSFPLSFGGAVRDVPVETRTPGTAFGWSALVKPHRFTLSAWATEASELATLRRDDLLRVFEAAPRVGYVVMRHVAAVVGRRLLQVQALWAREVQRVVTDSFAASPADNAGQRERGGAKSGGGSWRLAE